MKAVAGLPHVSRRRILLSQTLVGALVLLLLLIVPPATFYGWFEYRSRVVTDHHALGAGYADALKHAEAAATLYSILRLIGASDRTSERVTIRLGIINEYAEIYVKLGRKDSTLEMMRDLHNNMVGIAVAKWRNNTGADRRGRSEQLVALARVGVLLQSEDDVRLSREEMRRAKQSADLDWAISWFKQNKVAVEARAMQMLLDTRS
jgi:hypothetical protein